LLRMAGRLDPDAADPLCERLRAAAIAAPAAIADAVVRLRQAELGTRMLLLPFLGIVRVAGAVVPLLRGARDEALSERAPGALAGHGATAEAVLAQRWGALDVETRALACEALGRSRGGVGAARLVAALDAADPSVRIAA